MKKSILFLVICWIGTAAAQSHQKPSLFLPLNYLQAYQKGTRSWDGNPGPNYWQNHAKYTIHARVVPDSSLLYGQEVIRYHNNSPDTLRQMVIRLYQDYYRKGNARLYPVDESDLTDGVTLTLLVVNGDTLLPREHQFRIRRTQTNLIVQLPRRAPLAAGDSACLEIHWRFHIPEKRKLRMGRYSSDDFFIAYWYPQIAVYDDIDGWDTTDYLGPAEFYNDFNEYEVFVTLPGDFFLWSTGVLQNPEEIYTAELRARLERAMQADTTIRIITEADSLPDFGLQPTDPKIWHLSAHQVTDFSFALSKDNLWDAASVLVDSTTGRRALTAAVYPAGSPNYRRAAEVSAATIAYLSHELPGVAYPYPHVTTFCNGPYGGGMETPMMANNGAPGRWASAVDLIFHEISHNYFPFFMGINERKYGWMDEGWATFLPREVTDRLAPEDDYFSGIVLQYRYFAGDEMDMPPMIPTYLLGPGRTMQTASYSRPAVAYYMLNVLLGDDLFRRALREYIRRWNGKHPTPYDFFFTFDHITGQDLSWFWRPWFFDRGFPDLKLSSVEMKGERIKITIERLGHLPIPIALTLEDTTGSQQKLFVSADIWKDGARQYTLAIEPKLKATRVYIGNSYIPDINSKNNEIMLHGEN